MIVCFGLCDCRQDSFQINLIFDDYTNANDQVKHQLDVANDSNTKIDAGSQVHCDLPKPGLLLRPDGASSEKVILSYFPLNFHSS